MAEVNPGAVASRIDKLVADITGQWQQQNDAFLKSRQTAIGGLKTPTLRTPSAKTNLLEALGTTGGKAAFLKGTTGARFEKGAPSRLTRVAAALGPTLEGGQASLESQAARENAIAMAETQAANELLLNQVKLSQPSVDIGNILTSETSRMNTADRIRAAEELQTANITAKKDAAQLKAQGGGGVKISDILSAERVGNTQDRISVEAEREILSPATNPQQFAGDIHTDSKGATQIVNTEPVVMNPAALDANRNMIENYRQSMRIGSLVGAVPVTLNTDVFVMMPERSDSMFDFEGLTSNLYKRQKKINVSPRDFPIVMQVLQATNYDIYDAVEMARFAHNKNPNQALANFLATYEPIVASVVKD